MNWVPCKSCEGAKNFMKVKHLMNNTASVPSVYMVVLNDAVNEKMFAIVLIIPSEQRWRG